MAVIEALVRLGTSCGDATSAVSAAPMPSCAQARQSDAIRCNPCNRDSHLMWCDALGQTYLTVLVLAPCKDGGALMVVDERQHVEEAYRHGAHVVRHQLQHQRRLAGTLARQLSLSLSLACSCGAALYVQQGRSSVAPAPHEHAPGAGERRRLRAASCHLHDRVANAAHERRSRCLAHRSAEAQLAAAALAPRVHGELVWLRAPISR